MSFVNRPGRSIHFINRSIGPENAANPRLICRIETLLDGDFAIGRASQFLACNCASLDQNSRPEEIGS